MIEECESSKFQEHLYTERFNQPSTCLFNTAGKHIFTVQSDKLCSSLFQLIDSSLVIYCEKHYLAT